MSFVSKHFRKLLGALLLDAAAVVKPDSPSASAPSGSWFHDK